MFAIPSRAARAFAALLKRCGRPRDAPPFVFLTQGFDGLTLSAWRGAVGLRWHWPGASPPAALAFTADHLAAIGGVDVVIAPAGPAHAEARWVDGGAERTHRLPTVDPGRVSTFPTPAGKATTVPPAFLAALAEAGRTAAKEDTRFALSRVLLRGKAGQVVATDGRQLLVQAGFRLPWADDALVPAAPVFAAKELAAVENVSVGRSAGHVLVAAGPWTVALRADPAGRFPPFEDVVPRARPAARCEFHPDDAAALIAGVPRLPGGTDADAAVTLALSGGLTVRAADGTKTGEVRADRSTTEGSARVSCDRRYLVRALRLGLTAIEAFGPGKPLAARDGTRTYVWVALGDGYSVPSAAETVTPNSTPELEDPVPQPSPNGHLTPGGPKDGVHPPPDLLAEAEAVRDQLHAASARLANLIAALRRQRKQSRALLQAAEALRSLPSLGP